MKTIAMSLNPHTGRLLARERGTKTSEKLECGHPAECEGLAGESGDQPGCGWCADIADMGVLIDHLSRTYDHFSGGAISKPMTHPEEVFTLADDIFSEDVNAAIAEDRKDRAEDRDDDRRDAVRYRIMRKMPAGHYAKLCLLAEVESRPVDDLIEEMAPEFLGRTFEQELHRLASLDVAEEVFAGTEP